MRQTEPFSRYRLWSSTRLRTFVTLLLVAFGMVSALVALPAGAQAPIVPSDYLAKGSGGTFEYTGTYTGSYTFKYSFAITGIRPLGTSTIRGRRSRRISAV